MVIEKEKCSGCHTCYLVCPKQAIAMLTDKEGFLYPHIDNQKCTNCGLCKSKCPCKDKINAENLNSISYACFNNNENIRLKSSSGGIFYLLGKYVINHNGVVYGAAFDANFKIYHCGVENQNDLTKLMGSKYAQSELGNIYKDVKQNLSTGRMVLFVGTSCQISGLKCFLSNSYSNLITVDLICKSVSSPKIWQKYLEKFYSHQKIISVNFKDKTMGWNRFCVSIQTDRKDHLNKGRSDYYMQGFFKGLYNRPSCSNCNYKFPVRVSDLTLADCWGIEEMAPKLFDNKGASTVIINSEKGKWLFTELENEMTFQSINLKDVVEKNPYLAKCEKSSMLRPVFWFLYNRIPFKILMKIMAYPYQEKMIGTLRIIYHKLRRKQT